MIELFGWISAIALALCGIPQALKSYWDGHSRGLTWAFIFLWFAGEVFGLMYVFPMLKWPLIVNYAFNTIIVGVIVKYKIWERKPKQTTIPENETPSQRFKRIGPY